MSRRRYLKTSVSQEEYVDACQRADAEGLTTSAYLRAVLARDVGRQNITQTIHAALLSAPTPAAPGIEPDVQELLQLVRLLASQANPQAAARITAAMNQQRRVCV